jgi:hypothetical protein
MNEAVRSFLQEDHGIKGVKDQMNQSILLAHQLPGSEERG